ncbi:hypothetical protein AB0N05_08935 [Nocardia sp. NPDC051030]|uniref:hypothetical protein n=1 Tax=Nocardia sp. NPDC051030 TaxID=3155162 RepID=UPI00341B7340
MEIGEQGPLLVRHPRLDRARLVIEVEALEERLVEETTDFGAGVAVEDVWVGDEIEGVSKYAYADGELLGGVRQSGLEPFAFVLELDELHANLGLGHGSVGEEVDQATFFLVELFQLPVEACVCVPDGGLFVGDDLFQEISALGGEGAGELERAVVLLDCVLNRLDGEAWEIAQAFFAPLAGEVRVLVARAVGHPVEDQSRCMPCFAAPGAQQGALEVVVVDSIAISVGAAEAKDVLDAFVEVVAD